MMGARAVGVALVQATAGAAVLPGNAYAVPILQSTTGSGQSQSDWSRLVKVGARPQAGSSTPIPDMTIDPVADPGGTPVPIYAALGGSYYNAGTTPPGLATGTGLEWSPPIPGIEAVSVISTGMTGGTDLQLPGALRRALLLDRMGLGNMALKGGPQVPAEIWRSKLGDYPAAVLALMGAKDSEPAGRARAIREFSWRLHIITSSVGQTEERYADGDTILDYAEGLLEGGGDVDGQAFSRPSMRVGAARLMVADDGAFVHVIDFTSYPTLDRIEQRTFATWLESQATLVTDPNATYPLRSSALTGAGPVNFDM